MKIPLKYRLHLKIINFFNTKFSLIVEAEDRQFSTKYLCSNEIEVYRATTLWEKEPGTMRWIDENVHEGDIFLDIGANMGIYTLAAAHRVGKSGKVYAVEPHKVTAISLMTNIKLNDHLKTVDVFTNPLTDSLRIAEFNYKNFNSSVTGSQFGSQKINSNQAEFCPENKEICLGISIDILLELGGIKYPQYVKIDVDGIELDILRGMSKMLKSSNRPKSVQVELNVGEQQEIIDFMSLYGYVLQKRHLTYDGGMKIARGMKLEEIAHNAIFIPTN